MAKESAPKPEQEKLEGPIQKALRESGVTAGSMSVSASPELPSGSLITPVEEVSDIPESTAILEKMEQSEIDKRIDAAHALEDTASDGKSEKKPSHSVTLAGHLQREEMRRTSTLPIPSELREIYGTKLPPDIGSIVETYVHLGEQKRKGFMEILHAREDEYSEKQKSIREARKKEKQEREYTLRKRHTKNEPTRAAVERMENEGGLVSETTNKNATESVSLKTEPESYERLKVPASIRKIYGDTPPAEPILKAIVGRHNGMLKGKDGEESVQEYLNALRAEKSEQDRRDEIKKQKTEESRKKKERRSIKALTENRLPTWEGEGGLVPDVSPVTPEIKPDTPLAPSIPEAAPSAKVEANYLQKYSELLKEVKSMYGNKAPTDLEERISNIHKMHTQHGKADPVAETVLVTEIQELLDGIRMGAPINPKPPVVPPQSPEMGFQEIYEALQAEHAKYEEKLAKVRALYGDDVPPDVAKKLLAIESLQAAHGGRPEEYAPLLRDLDTLIAEAAPTGSIAANQEDLPAPLQKSEGTPKEWRDKLRGLIHKAQEKLDVPGKAERLKAKVSERLKELSAKAKDLGPGAGKAFLAMGKKYDELSTREKIGLGIVLAGGAVVAAPVSGVFGALIGLQRAAGASSMYQKLEKRLQDGNFKGQEWYEKRFGNLTEKQKKIVAATVTAAVALGASYAIKEGVEYASHTEAGQSARDFITRMLYQEPGSFPQMPHSARPVGGLNPIPAAALGEEPLLADSPVIEQAPLTEEDIKIIPEAAEAEPVLSAAPEILQTAPEHAVTPDTAPVPERPSVEAAPGKGYEYMTKRLWEQLQEKGADVSKYPEGSDIRRLAEATPDTIDKVVHDLAIENEFYKPDGSNVRIDIGDKLSFSPDGSLEKNGEIFPKADAPETPPYNPNDTTSEMPIQTETTITEPAPESASGEVADAASVKNEHGLTVSFEKTTMYQGEEGEIFVYGGSGESQLTAIENYLKQHPDKTVFSSDANGKYRIPWRIVEGKLTPGDPVHESILGIFKTFLKPPGPEDFIKTV